MSVSMARAALYLFTSVSVLALAGCEQQQASPDGKLTDQEKRSFQLAESLAANGSLADAKSLYEQLAARPEAAVQADLALAAIDRKTGHAEDAVDVMHDAQKQAPDNSAVLTELGYDLIAAGHPEDAVNIFDELIAMQPNNASMYNAKAVAFDKAGNHVAAQEIYQKALSLEPNSLPVRNNLAMSYILNDQADDAITLLEPLVRNKTANATVRQNLALAYGIKGDHAHAMELNAQDVTPEQAKENLHFYEKYSQAKRQHASVDLGAHMPPVIKDTTPTAENTSSVPEPKPEPTPAKKAKPIKPVHAKPAPKPKAEEPDNMAPSDVQPPAMNAETPSDSGNAFFGPGALYEYPNSNKSK